jgi:hypothetical protein
MTQEIEKAWEALGTKPRKQTNKPRKVSGTRVDTSRLDEYQAKAKDAHEGKETRNRRT